MTDLDKDLYLIEKRGLYYRPESAGYTGLKSRAGRFSFEDAAVIAGPNGPEGPQDGIKIVREADASDFAPCCSSDVRLTYTTAENARNEALEEVAAWHEKNRYWCLEIASDEPRIAADARKKAKEAAAHHAASMNAIRAMKRSRPK